MDNSGIQKIYPLSPIQEGMLFHSLLNNESHAYFEQVSVEIVGSLDLDMFQRSFDLLVERHDVLRTIFLYEEVERPCQVVLTEMSGEVYYQDISQLTKAEQKSFIKNFQEEDKCRGFSLSEEILMRVSVLQIGEENYTIIWSFHHIIMDGWCISIILHDFNLIYKTLLEGQTLKLEPAPSYSDYIKFLEKRDKAKAQTYWENYLTDYEQEAGLAKFASKRENEKYIQEQVVVEFDSIITEKLLNLARQNQVTINIVIQAIWGIILQKYNNTSDVVFGSVVSGRSAEVAGVEQMVGLFINTIPVRVSREKVQSFKQVLKETQKKALESAEYDYYPLAKIQANSALKQSLIDHIIVFENFPIGQGIEANNQQGMPFKMGNVEFFEQTNYDFNIVVIPTDNLTIKFQYNALVFAEEFVEQIRRQFRKIVETVVKNDEILLSNIGLISEDECLLLNSFNNKHLQYPADKTIHQLFTEQAKKTPEVIALSFENQHLTYRELEEKSNQLARILQSKGVSCEEPVGIFVERSLEMIIGLLGILKAGGAYLPIDPDYPEERVKYMITNSATKVLLTQASLVQVVPEDVICIDITNIRLYSGDVSELENNSSANLAYIIYTSGSTGKPKGVMIEHRQVNNCIFWMQNEFHLKSTDTVVQRTNLTFDPSVWEIFWPLYVGAKAKILTGEQSKDAEFILQLLSGNTDLSVMYCPASLVTGMNYLLNSQPAKHKLNLPLLIIGAEPISMSVVKSFYTYFTGQIVNTYGPTECTINNTYCYLEREDSSLIVPIGKPVANNQIYILNHDLQLMPLGVPGEIYIGGDSVGRGYINNPEKTKEAFIDNLFGSRLYKTGDRGRWLEDGNIEIMGRVDSQVKIRGFRIELGEIESQLLKHPGIKEAVVIYKEDDSGNKYLCTYFTGNEEISENELREYLGRELPDYMIPAYLMQLEKMPVTSNGKIDRKNLPEPVGKMMGEYIEPTSELEEKLAEIWANVLGKEQVGITDNFFELGGDSIKAIQILAKANSQGINITVKDIFKYKNITEILNKADLRPGIQAEQGEVTGEVLLTPIQRWFFTQNFTQPNYYNQISLFNLRADVDLDLLTRCFKEIISHHDALRMSYTKVGDEITQFNRGNDQVEFALQIVDLVDYPADVQKEKIKEFSETAQSKLNLAEDVLMKVIIFDLGPNGKRILIAIHHLVVDGVSWRILLEDLENLYMSNLEEKLPLKTTSFKEWSEKLTNYAKTAQIDLHYWENIDENELKYLTIHGAEKHYLRDYRKESVELSKEVTETLLTKVNQTYNTEINDTLLTAFVLAYTEMMGVKNLFLSLEGHGREEFIEDIDISRTVGWFTSMYPIYLERRESIEELIISVKENLRKVPNKGVNFGIARYLADVAYLKKLNPEITFNYLGQFDNVLEKPTDSLLDVCQEDPGMSAHLDNQYSSLFDVNCMVIGGKMQISINYHTRYFTKHQIQHFQSLLQSSLDQIIHHCLHKEDRFFTESDLGEEGILQDDLDILAKEFKL